MRAERAAAGIFVPMRNAVQQSAQGNVVAPAASVLAGSDPKKTGLKVELECYHH